MTSLAILGAGRMARALAPAWLAADHDVVIAGRDPDRAAALAAEIGARSAPLAEAARAADVGVLAVRWEGVPWTLEQIGGHLAGRPLVDVCNPVEVERFTLVTPPGTSLAEQVAAATGALVAKAFNLAQADVWSRPRTVAGAGLVVPVATDHDAARAAVDDLAGALGATTLDAGELVHARHLEAMAAVVIRRLFAGDPACSTFAWADVGAAG